MLRTYTDCIDMTNSICSIPKQNVFGFVEVIQLMTEFTARRLERFLTLKELQQ